MTGPSTRQTIPTILTLAAAGACLAQTDLYSNGSFNPSVPALATGSVTFSGTPAPNGAQWSEAPHIDPWQANSIAGFSGHGTGLIGAYRFADNFTIPGPDAWRLERASFYAYQTDAPPTSSPFVSVNVRIWRGQPGQPGSTVIFGDTTTNRLISSTPTQIYRIFNTVSSPALPPTTNRRIWQTDVDLGRITLPPGTYWIDWQYTSADPLLHAFSPPVTRAGIRGPFGANALQFRPDGEGVWIPVIDPGKPSSIEDVAQDFPFILRGAITCAADFNADNTVNSQDFFDFLSAFFQDSAEADFNFDQLVNSQDFFDFMVAFFACA